MIPLLTLLASSAYLQPLTNLLGWVGWVILLGMIIAVVVRWRGYEALGGNRWILFVVFLLLIPLTSLFLGFHLQSGSALPESGISVSPHNPTLMVLSALPWMLAGGFLGPISAALVGLLVGLVRCVWDTHNVFTILAPAILAVLFSIAARQRYRTFIYRTIRQPLVLTLCLIPVYALIFIVSALFSISGSLAVCLDFALTNIGPATLAVAGELLIAGLSVQILAVSYPVAWGQEQPLHPSPSEKSLETRYMIGGGMFIILLLVSLLIGDWVVAGSAARRLIHDRLSSTARVAAESVPFFLETDQNLAVQLAQDPRLLTESGDSLSTVLSEQISSGPYFDQLFILDMDGRLVAAYPLTDSAGFALAPEESTGIGLAVQGVAVQIYTIFPTETGGAGRVSFMVAVGDGNGLIRRVLLGRSDLSRNPLTQPLINVLHSVETLHGEGLLLDEQGRILYSRNANQIMTPYLGERGDQAKFYDIPAPGGTRDLVYYQPVIGRSWAVVLIVPAEQVQQMTIDIAAPLSVLILVLALIALVSLRLSLQGVTASMQNLASEAARIAQGQFDHSLHVEGVDEVGQLRRAFEQMRVSLHARLEELKQLLLVSQGVASTLEMEGAVQPILEAVLVTGASTVRVVLMPSYQLEEGTPLQFCLGPAKDTYAYLDEQVLILVQKPGRLVLNNMIRVRGLDLPAGRPHPAALIAVALYHENHYYGVLWAGYDRPRSFSEEEVRFLSTLAGYTALAAVNARLFRTAEVGRQRLAAILTSTPDPVLVTDQEDCLLLANPAARQALNVSVRSVEGRPIEEIINQMELRDLLQVEDSGKQSVEVELPDGKVYFATASSVIADGRPVGRVCVMRDVTHFKELDVLKSDFVSTVSHDLRSPLTLMRGYATMLEMVGEINEQQRGYVSKIVIGVESMSRMVNSLLDLGRIEAGVGLQVEKVPVMDVLDYVTSMLHLQADQKNIHLGVEVARDLPQFIDADKALLQQAVYNLAENAIKYTPQGGSVMVRLKVRLDGILFEIQDNGIGIPSADQPRLFEKFFRGSHRDARQQRGNGLGLAIVRSIAERHGGKVWLESTLGQGSTFSLLIPFDQPEQKKRLKAV